MTDLVPVILNGSCKYVLQPDGLHYVLDGEDPIIHTWKIKREKTEPKRLFYCNVATREKKWKLPDIRARVLFGDDASETVPPMDEGASVTSFTTPPVEHVSDSAPRVINVDLGEPLVLNQTDETQGLLLGPDGDVIEYKNVLNDDILGEPLPPPPPPPLTEKPNVGSNEKEQQYMQQIIAKDVEEEKLKSRVRTLEEELKKSQDDSAKKSLIIDGLQTQLSHMKDKHMKEITRLEVQLAHKSQSILQLELSPPRTSSEVDKLRAELEDLKKKYDTEVVALRHNLEKKDRELIAAGESEANALVIAQRHFEATALHNAQMYLDYERKLMQEYVAEYCDKCNGALADAKGALEERALALESNATQLEYDLRLQYKQKEEELALKISDQSSAIQIELNRMRDEHKQRITELEHNNRVEYQRLANEFSKRKLQLEEEFTQEKAALQEVAHKEILKTKNDGEERMRTLRLVEQQLHEDLAVASGRWDALLEAWNKECVPIREALNAAVKNVHSAAVVSERAREEGVRGLQQSFQKSLDDHINKVRAETAVFCTTYSEEQRKQLDSLELTLKTVQVEAQNLRERLSTQTLEHDAKLAKRDAENRRNVELWEAEKEAERQALESTIKRLRDSLQEERDESRMAQQRVQQECEALHRTVREMQATLANERTLCNQKECDMLIEVERARAEVATHKRDEEMRVLNMKEEIESKVRIEVEAFKRRFLELRDATGAYPGVDPSPRHNMIMDTAANAVDNSQRLRVRRLREWTTTAVGGPSAAPSERSHLSPRRILEDARVIQPQSLMSSSRSVSGMSVSMEPNSRSASEAYQRLQNLSDKLKTKLGQTL